MAKCWQILIMGRRCDVVGKRQAMHGVFKVHVQQALVGAIKGNAALRHGEQGIVVSQIGRQHHDASVEKIWPSNVWRSAERVLNGKELIRGAIGDDIRVYIDDLGELGLLPEVDLCKRGVEVGAVHEVEVRGVLVADSRDGNNMIEDGLELGDGVGRDTVEGKKDGELFRGPCVAKGMRQNKRTWEIRVRQQ